MSIQEQHILDDTRPEVDTRTIIIETLIQPPQREEGGETKQFRTEKVKRKMPRNLTSSYEMASDMPTTLRPSLNATRLNNYVMEWETTI